MRFLLIATLMLSFTAYAQEESSREFADGVIELTTVKVKTNFLQDYLDGIEKTWVAAAKIQKEMGIISDYNVCLLYTSQSPRDRTRSRMPSSA